MSATMKAGQYALFAEGCGEFGAPWGPFVLKVDAVIGVTARPVYSQKTAYDNTTRRHETTNQLDCTVIDIEAEGGYVYRTTMDFEHVLIKLGIALPEVSS